MYQSVLSLYVDDIHTRRFFAMNLLYLGCPFISTKFLFVALWSAATGLPKANKKNQKNCQKQSPICDVMFDIFIQRLENNNFQSCFMLLPDPAAIRCSIAHVQFSNMESMKAIHRYPASCLLRYCTCVNRPVTSLPADFILLVGRTI